MSIVAVSSFKKMEVKMIMEKPISHLTKRDYDILNILWSSPVPLTASEIVKSNPELTINTVQAVLRRLLKNNFLEVADIVYSGTVLCRSYKPTVSANDFTISEFAAEFRNLAQNIPSTSLVAAFLELETDKTKAKDEIEALESLLQKYKEQLSE